MTKFDKKEKESSSSSNDNAEKVSREFVGAVVVVAGVLQSNAPIFKWLATAAVIVMNNSTAVIDAILSHLCFLLTMLLGI